MHKEQLTDVYFPSLVGDNFNEPLSDEASFEYWKMSQKASSAMKDLYYSPSVARYIHLMQNQHNLNNQTVFELSKMLRNFFLGEIDKQTAQEKFIQLLRTNYETGALAFDRLLRLKTIDTTTDFSEKNTTPSPQKMEKILFSLLKSTYPDVFQQKISKNDIKVGDKFYPATIKNWLALYEKKHGIGSRDAIMRGDFIYRSNETKNLTQEERQNLTQLLKAADENTMLSVDTNAHVIVWDRHVVRTQQQQQQQLLQKRTDQPKTPLRHTLAQKKEDSLQKKPLLSAARQKSAQDEHRNVKKFTFSSGQTMSTEKGKSPKTRSPYNIKPIERN